jgi:NADH dehydrogenase FAD-containing subunit
MWYFQKELRMIKKHVVIVGSGFAGLQIRKKVEIC